MTAVGAPRVREGEGFGRDWVGEETVEIGGVGASGCQSSRADQNKKSEPNQFINQRSVETRG